MRKFFLFCSFFTVCLIFFGFTFFIHADEKCSKTLSPYFDRCEMVKASSREFAARFARRSLDLVYIDANHLAVKRDIDAWVPALKKSGFLLGHDWGWPEVRKDVESFASKFGYTVLVNGLGEWLIEMESGRQGLIRFLSRTVSPYSQVNQNKVSMH